MEVGCVIFGMNHKKAQKIPTSKAGMMWRFGGI
jgi:hypothetical protein